MHFRLYKLSAQPKSIPGYKGKGSARTAYARSARTGEPPARVPHDKTVRRTVLSPLLRFYQKEISPCAAGRPKAPPLDWAAFEKAGETFNFGYVRLVF
jgi:hypothetical protein